MKFKSLIVCTTISALGSVHGTTVAAEEAYLRSQREQTISEVVANACNGSGRVDPRAIHVIDLTMDGTDDFIIDESGITCKSGGMSINCGAQVCSSRIFVFESEYYVENLETLGIVTKIKQGTPPTIEISRHGGAIENIRWRGNSFK